MTYVVYHKETTKLLRSPSGGVGCYKEFYKSEAAAKAALTRASRPWRKNAVKAEDYAVADAETFRTKIEKTVTVRSLMNGALVEQPVNTPRCCDPSSELYWSM